MIERASIVRIAGFVTMVAERTRAAQSATERGMGRSGKETPRFKKPQC